MMREVFDEEAEKRSLMMQRPRKCDGEADGFECEHLWYQVMPVRSSHADLLKIGERTRACTLHPGHLGAMDDLYDMPHTCNRYKKSDRPYDATTRMYDPLTPDQVDALSVPADDEDA